MRWTHAHTGLAGAFAGLWFARSPLLVLLVVAAVAFTAGLLAGRFWRGVRAAKAAVTAEIAARAEALRHTHDMRRAGLRAARAKARVVEAKARDGKAIAAEAKRRAERARGVTNSEIAQLQMGRR